MPEAATSPTRASAPYSSQARGPRSEFSLSPVASGSSTSCFFFLISFFEFFEFFPSFFCAFFDLLPLFSFFSLLTAGNMGAAAPSGTEKPSMRTSLAGTTAAAGRIFFVSVVVAGERVAADDLHLPRLRVGARRPARLRGPVVIAAAAPPMEATEVRVGPEGEDARASLPRPLLLLRLVVVSTSFLPFLPLLRLLPRLELLALQRHVVSQRDGQIDGDLSHLLLELAELLLQGSKTAAGFAAAAALLLVVLTSELLLVLHLHLLLQPCHLLLEGLGLAGQELLPALVPERP